MMTVVVVGASNKAGRFSFQAIQMLLKGGHRVLPVHPRIRDVLGIAVLSRLSEIHEPVDTVTLYVSGAVSSGMMEDILALSPRRLIVNPGAENARLEQMARERGIQVVRGCTIIMLKTGQF